MMSNTMYQHLAQRIQQMTGQPHYSAAMQSQDSQMFSRLHRDRLCLETQLHDEAFTLPMLEFYVFVCAWLLHLADPEDRGLPLAKEVPAAFGSVPEYVVEDVAEFFTFISNVVPEHLEMLRVRHTIPSTFRHFVFSLRGLWLGLSRHSHKRRVATTPSVGPVAGIGTKHMRTSIYADNCACACAQSIAW